MKKLTAVLLALVLLFALSATAFADEEAPMQTLSWLSARRGIQQAGLNGSFYQVADLDCDVWIPDLLEPMEEKPDYSYLVFGTDGVPIVSVDHLSFDEDVELEDIEEMLPDWGAVSDGIFWINNLHALVYEKEAEDSLSALILKTEGDAVEFVFSPISNQDVYSLSSLILSTIQRHTLDNMELALMMDGDLNTNWGPNRSVRLAETDEGEVIRVFLWDDGVDSETIQNTSNWDAVRASKLALWNEYAEALAELGFDETPLEVLYISPEEDLSFLTIRDGEIVYDVFEDAA